MSASIAAHADYQYTYTGPTNSLSYVYDGVQDATLTGVSQVTFQFDTTAPLFVGQTDHLTNNVVSWSMSDGKNSMTSALCATTSGCTGFTGGYDYLTFNSSGQITSWAIAIAEGGPHSIETATSGTTPGFGDKSGSNIIYDFTSDPGNVVANVSGAGLWTVAQISPVPLPASVWLMLSGVGGIVVFTRKKRAA
jgi:hypothetical protein